MTAVAVRWTGAAGPAAHASVALITCARRGSAAKGERVVRPAVSASKPSCLQPQSSNAAETFADARGVDDALAALLALRERKHGALTPAWFTRRSIENVLPSPGKSIDIKFDGSFFPSQRTACLWALVDERPRDARDPTDDGRAPLLEGMPGKQQCNDGVKSPTPHTPAY